MSLPTLKPEKFKACLQLDKANYNLEEGTLAEPGGGDCDNWVAYY